MQSSKSADLPIRWWPVPLAILVLWISLPIVMVAWFKAPQDAGGYGDAFGAVNALFSGLAFAILIHTLFLQRRELQQNTEELGRQAEAMNRQLQVMRLSAQITALPVMLKNEWERFRNSESTICSELSQSIHSAEDLRLRIQSMEEKLKSHKFDRNEAETTLQLITPPNAVKEWPKAIHDKVRELSNVRLRCDREIPDMEQALPFMKRIHRYMQELETSYEELAGVRDPKTLND